MFSSLTSHPYSALWAFSPQNHFNWAHAQGGPHAPNKGECCIKVPKVLVAHKAPKLSVFPCDLSQYFPSSSPDCSPTPPLKPDLGA